MKQAIVAALALLLISACAHLQSGPQVRKPYRASGDARELSRVIPREGGEFDVISAWKSQAQAETWALEMARQTCDERGQRFAVLSQQVEYKGMVPEEVNRKADVVRGHVPIPIVRNIFIPNLRSRDDYQVGFRVKCEGTLN